ncbi:MAG: hypothetical protein IJ192_04845 [Clostridia bacterium]|nr:hypothetical protein [Clostridia bacterium]
MRLEVAFQIVGNSKDGDCQLLIGRLLSDISLQDKLIYINEMTYNEFLKANYPNGNYPNDHLQCHLCNNDLYFYVDIIHINSYGRFWDFINKPMSAQLKCKFLNKEFDDKTSLEGCLLFKIIS